VHVTMSQTVAINVPSKAVGNPDARPAEFWANLPRWARPLLAVLGVAFFIGAVLIIVFVRAPENVVPSSSGVAVTFNEKSTFLARANQPLSLFSTVPSDCEFPCGVTLQFEVGAGFPSLTISLGDAVIVPTVELAEGSTWAISFDELGGDFSAHCWDIRAGNCTFVSTLVYPYDQVLGTYETRSQSSVVPNKGIVTTIAGKDSAGFVDGVGSNAQFNEASGICLDYNNFFYIADSGNNAIRRVTADGVVTTIAGHLNGESGYSDEYGTDARFHSPADIAVDSMGVLYVADLENNAIRRIADDGAVTTFAGSTDGDSGFADGTGTNALFNFPIGIRIDADDNLFVTEAGNNAIRKINQAGEVTTIAGSLDGTAGFVNGQGTNAQFNQPNDVHFDGKGNIYVADFGNNVIRKIGPTGWVTTLAGNGNAGYVDAAGVNAQFNGPTSVAVDQNGFIYVTDYNNNVIRKVSPIGVVSTLAGTTGGGSADGLGASAGFVQPSGIQIDAIGHLYIAEWGNSAVRRIV
jgi:sugar lactone lactonase YvrE